MNKYSIYYCTTEKDEGNWYYGLDYHPPAKDTAFSEYSNDDDDHYSRVCNNANCDSDHVSAGSKSAAKVEGWNYDEADCMWYAGTE